MDSNSVNSNTNNTEADDEHKYNLQFTFDTDVRCAITVYYFATEEISGGLVRLVLVISGHCV